MMQKSEVWVSLKGHIIFGPTRTDFKQVTK